MKIVIYSPWFYPSVGGLENVMLTLAGEFVSRGHEVKVVTKTAASDAKTFPFDVLRRPTSLQLLKLVRWCDVYFQANLSLRGIWPVMFLNKALTVNHHGWYFDERKGKNIRAFLKLLMVRLATNISVSQAVASHLPVASTVIPNPYREDIFRAMPYIRRERDLIFVGRLVSDKGVDVLIDALGILCVSGIMPRLTIAGAGPEETGLRRQVEERKLEAQVDFAGLKTGRELAELLNQHRIMIVPSRIQEGFGVVALEGIACGCVVVASDTGGLREAVGPCGVTFPSGDAKALADILSKLLLGEDKLGGYRSEAKKHLSLHQRAHVADAYLKVFERASHG